MEDKKQLLIFESKDELLGRALEESGKAEQAFQKSTELYFIARYFVAVYESRNHEIPIQVWNEYRNALDHYFRWQTFNNRNSQEAKSHLSKLERHLLRACLDVLKLFLHRTLENAEKWRDRYEKDVYELVDNGKFFTRLVSLEKEIRQKFERAKILDAGLGDDHDHNQSVLDKYLDASFLADSLLMELINRQEDFQQAKSNLEHIYKAAHNLSISEHFRIHFWFYVLWTVGTAILSSATTWIVSEYGDDVKSSIAQKFNEQDKEIDSVIPETKD